MNTIGFFEIHSSNPAREAKFYEAVFNWNFTLDKNLPIEYYRIETNSINGGLLKRPNPLHEPGQGVNAFVNSIQVENIDQTIDLILQHGAKIILPKFEIPGTCWQAYFCDQDNNTFGLFEVIKQ